MDSALPGNTISHYRIVSKIGEGGMGTVYEAEDTRLHRTVALKFLSPGYTGESESARRFVREARTASALDHPNICTIYDVDETEDGHLFIAMAHYTGQTLKELLQHGPLEVNQAVDYAVQIGEGLAAAHARGIIHRDLKPANIFITDENLVKILDFGVAKLTGTPEVTRNGVLIGTPHYMAPEQITGQTVDQRADIWALGVIVYEMLCGKQPFCGEHEQSVIYSILEKEPKSINFQKTCIPESTFYCINRMLQKQPDDRPDSCKSIIRILSNHQFPDLINFEKNRRKSEVEWPRVTASIVFFTIIVIVLISFTDMRPFSSNPAPNRIMILDFENQTNDAALDPLGRMAAGWIRQGLVGTGFLEVVDEPTTFTVQKYFKEEAISGIVSQSKNVGNETGAELLVTGAYYLYNDTIQMHAQISDTRSGDLFLALNPVEHHRDRISEIVKTIQQSTMTALASHVDPRLGRHEGTLDFPPNYSAYQNYLAGVENFYNDRFPQAAQSFERAVSLDSNFYHAFLWAGKSHLLVANRMVFPDNETEIRRHLKRVDEIIHLLIESKNELSEYERHHLDFLIARREGDFEGVYQAAIKMMKAAPGSQEAIREAATNAGRTCRHKIALSLWEELDPERGLMRSFGENYYHYYTFELHFAGKHRREYAVAKKGRILHPEPWKMWFLETRALVALGHVNRAVEIIDEAEFVLDRMGYLWLLWWTAHELYIHGPADQKFVLLERFSDSFQDYMIWLEAHEQERLRPFRETFIRVLFYLDKFEEAHDLLNELLIEYGDSSYLQWISGVIAAQRGEIALARSISDELAVSLPDSLYRQKYGSNFGRRAGIAAWLGEFDEAVYLLKKSYYRREPEAPCRDLMLRPLWGYQAFEGMIKGIDTEKIY